MKRPFDGGIAAFSSARHCGVDGKAAEGKFDPLFFRVGEMHLHTDAEDPDAGRSAASQTLVREAKALHGLMRQFRFDQDSRANMVIRREMQRPEPVLRKPSATLTRASGNAATMLQTQERWEEF